LPHAVDGDDPRDHNRIVRFVSAVVAFIMTLAFGAAGWAKCVGEQSVHAQMKCCATMHHRCGTRNPHDCCNDMKESAPSSAVATNAVAKTKAPVALGSVHLLAAPTVDGRANSAQVQARRIRPHDPPHLHAFPLLI